MQLIPAYISLVMERVRTITVPRYSKQMNTEGEEEKREDQPGLREGPGQRQHAGPEGSRHEVQHGGALRPRVQTGERPLERASPSRVLKDLTVLA